MATIAMEQTILMRDRPEILAEADLANAHPEEYLAGLCLESICKAGKNGNEHNMYIGHVVETYFDGSEVQETVIKGMATAINKKDRLSDEAISSIVNPVVDMLRAKRKKELL